MQQPQFAAQIDWSNPLTIGLIDSFNANGPLMLSNGVPMQISGTTGGGSKATSAGNAISYVGSITGVNYKNSAPSPNVDEVSMFVIAIPNDITASNFPILSYNNSGGTPPLLHIGTYSAGGTPAFRVRDSLSVNQEITGSDPAWQNGVPALLVATRSQSKGITKLFINGRLLASVATVTQTLTSFDRTAIGGFYRVGAFSNPWTGSVVTGGTWNRALSDQEVASLSANPWQVFK